MKQTVTHTHTLLYMILNVYEKTQGQHCSIKLHTVQLVLHDENLTYCVAQGTLLHIMWQHGWDGSLGNNRYM